MIILIGNLLQVRPWSEGFRYSNSFNPENNPTRYILSLSLQIRKLQLADFPMLSEPVSSGTNWTCPIP